MVDSIKSLYFTKIIFKIIQERTKLKIAKYNKNLQRIIDISLVNYKILSERYIIFEENGKGKEYNKYNDTLLFEGEYLNGKRNGKGKEYDCNGNLIFEGEYLNGKRNGKGKQYFQDGKLLFEGEYLNGIRIIN